MNSDPNRHGRSWLNRYCWLTAVFTFFLVLAGGMVTSTDSGLAVPDWPLSYGQLMPPMVGGIFYEHGHRMVATFVGFLTVVLAIWLWRVEDRKWVRNLGMIALGAVIAQGILGGLTVLFLLPTAISVSHATMAQSFFALIVFITLVTSPSWRKAEPEYSASTSHTRNLSLIVCCAVFLQLIIGALMRHTGSGLAVPDFPLAYGQLWPSLDSASMNGINQSRAELGLLPVHELQVAIHLLHRLWAVVVAVLMVVLVRRIFLNHERTLALREPALLMLTLAVFQVFLGGLTIWTGRDVAVTTAHVGGGALILATTVLIVARSYRFLGTTIEKPAGAIAGAEGAKV